MISENKSAIVIGAGLSGLAAAFRLQELGNEDFLVLEAGTRVGGTIETVERDGFLLETGADSFLSEKTAALNLIRRLGIEDELIQTNDENRRVFIVRGNKLRPIPEGFQLIAPTNVEAFFKSEILSQRGKIRLANERFLPPAPARDDETLADFVRRRFGQEALERIAQPMFAGIYTANPETLSMRATQPRFLDLEQKYGSVIAGLQQQSKVQNPKSKIGDGVRYSLFLSFKNGMRTLIDALASKLTKDFLHLAAQPQTVRFNTTSRLWHVHTDHEIYQTKSLCLALPTGEIARLLQDQFPAIAGEFAEIETASTATVNFGFRREQILHKLDGFGFVVPFVEKKTLLAATFSSVKFARRAPENHVLLRAFIGGAMQPDKFALDDAAMIDGALQDLRELVGLTGNPLFAHVARWANSMPQYKIGHLAKAARIEKLLAEIPNLHIATTATDGVGIPDSIRHGETAAERIIEN